MSASGQERFVNFYTDFAFQRLFEQAEIAQYTPAEVGEYERSLKEYRDIINVVNSAERKGFSQGHEKGMAEGIEKGMAEGIEKGMTEGRAEGRAEGEKRKQMEIARNAKAMGIDSTTISQLTGISIEEIENL